MATKKSSKKDKGPLDIQKLMQDSDSYKSLIYGIVTVVVLFIVIALGVRTLSQNRAEIDNQAVTTENADDVLTNEYVVTEGETLWSIAEKSYNNGYAWEEIARANDLSEPYQLEEGQKLTIPRLSKTPTPSEEKMDESSTAVATVVPTEAPAVTPAQTQNQAEVPTAQKIAGTSYKIVEGDSLWTIAERAYGDGYRWVEIARENNIENPDLIYPENTLTLSRP